MIFNFRKKSKISTFEPSNTIEIFESSVTKEIPLSKNDGELIGRILAYYRNTYQMEVGPEDGWLKTIFDIKYSIHETLLNEREEKVSELLNNPARSKICYGFDALYGTEDDQVYVRNIGELIAKDFLKLAEIVGARRFPYPGNPREPFVPSNIEPLLLELDEMFGFRIEFPNPYSGEWGLATSRGIASHRTVQALYQAWKCSQLVGNRLDCSILEIGGGFGRAAYYAYKFGLTNYTIVDLPMTSVAHSHFLANALNPDSISFYGESKGKGIHIIPPLVLFENDWNFDLVVNFDGLTEIDYGSANRYWDYMERNTPIFLSVNHEANVHTVRDYYTARGQKATRSPYYLREGYLEEVIRFPTLSK